MEDDNNTASKLMNDEIKEILDKINNVVNHKEASYNALVETKAEDYKQLLDYITNLQQENQELKSNLELYENGVYFSSKVDELERENERLKEKSINEVLKNDFDMCVKDLKKANKKIEKLEDYKSRCEKAIPMLKELNIKLKGILNTGIDIKEISDIEDTLNGRSDE